MSEESRIELWRRTVRLFKNYRRGGPGPFYRAGITKFIVESEIDNKITPDVIGWNPDDTDDVILLEITLNDKDKTKQIGKYRTIDLSRLSTLGIQTKKQPDIALGVFYENPADVCQLILGEKLSFSKTERINNEKIRKYIEESEGLDLTRVSELPFRFLPESKDMELRMGMVSSIMKIFEPKRKSIGVDEIVKDGLDVLYNNVSFKARKILENRIDRQMENLIKNHLKEYLIYKKNTYTLTARGEEVHKHTQSRNKVNKELTAWSNFRAITEYG